ncbi:membrane protein [Azospira sp. I13]|uniref:Tim44 domain-containing protein n=1 Tax=Azospira sp. I13 TaxID=1765050 RepID=UPI000D4DAAEB|nr:TIM44-like domain-containing protein [Azospira sp. I13]GBG02264.1 membrane protein [Azospira sp. I13]
MQRSILALCVLALGLTLAVPDAEAARLGGGRSSGMQRSVTPQHNTSPAPAAPQRQSTAPAQQAQPAPGAPAPQAAAPKRSWLGPIAGLAAGLGLAALASHFGFGEGMANFLMIALLVMGAIVVFRLLFRRPAAAQRAEPLQYVGVGGPSMAPVPETPAQPMGASASAAPAAAPVAAAATPAANIPADFDVEGFLRVAKLNFVRLQAANDQGNLDDMREFLAPEMFAEVQLQLAERGGKAQQTDVVQLEATLLEVVSEAGRHIASVRFHGLLREEKEAAPAPFDEVWHLVKPVDGSRGWMVAGIQQLA